MQPTRRSVLAVAAVLVLGVAAVVLVVFASAGGSVQPVSESTMGATLGQGWLFGRPGPLPEG